MDNSGTEIMVTGRAAAPGTESALCEAGSCDVEVHVLPRGRVSRFCVSHQHLEVRVRNNKSCMEADCQKNPHYGVSRLVDPNSKAVYCSSHKKRGMINIHGRKCQFRGCMKQPRFDYTGGKGKFCSGHRYNGMVDVLYRPCAAEGCKKHPHFGLETGGPRYCASHRFPGMVDVKHPRCHITGCMNIRMIGEDGRKARCCAFHEARLHTENVSNTDGSATLQQTNPTPRRGTSARSRSTTASTVPPTRRVTDSAAGPERVRSRRPQNPDVEVGARVRSTRKRKAEPSSRVSAMPVSEEARRERANALRSARRTRLHIVTYEEQDTMPEIPVYSTSSPLVKVKTSPVLSPGVDTPASFVGFSPSMQESPERDMIFFPPTPRTEEVRVSAVPLCAASKVKEGIPPPPAAKTCLLGEVLDQVLSRRQNEVTDSSSHDAVLVSGQGVQNTSGWLPFSSAVVVNGTAEDERVYKGQQTPSALIGGGSQWCGLEATGSHGSGKASEIDAYSGKGYRAEECDIPKVSSVSSLPSSTNGVNFRSFWGKQYDDLAAEPGLKKFDSLPEEVHFCSSLPSQQIQALVQGSLSQLKQEDASSSCSGSTAYSSVRQQGSSSMVDCSKFLKDRSGIVGGNGNDSFTADRKFLSFLQSEYWGDGPVEKVGGATTGVLHGKATPSSLVMNGCESVLQREGSPKDVNHCQSFSLSEGRASSSLLEEWRGVGSEGMFTEVSKSQTSSQSVDKSSSLPLLKDWGDIIVLEGRSTEVAQTQPSLRSPYGLIPVSAVEVKAEHLLDDSSDDVIMAHLSRFTLKNEGHRLQCKKNAVTAAVAAVAEADRGMAVTLSPSVTSTVPFACPQGYPPLSDGVMSTNMLFSSVTDFEGGKGNSALGPLQSPLPMRLCSVQGPQHQSFECDF